MVLPDNQPADCSACPSHVLRHLGAAPAKFLMGECAPGRSGGSSEAYPIKCFAIILLQMLLLVVRLELKPGKMASLIAVHI